MARRRSDAVEDTLVQRILDGSYPAGERLPLERDLAAELGVGRPTLREAVQRLERDGWLTVRKGTGTVVTDYWRDGTLAVVSAMLTHGVDAPLTTWLAELRVGLTPRYVHAAVAADPARVVAVLAGAADLPDTASAYAAFDARWQLELAGLADNPLYTLTLRSFRGAFGVAGLRYFADPARRAASHGFYGSLLDAAMARDPDRAEALTREAMLDAARHLRQETTP